MTDLDDYHRLRRWIRGVKPPAKGRQWQRGQRATRPPRPQHHLFLEPRTSSLTLPTGETVTYQVQQLVSAEGWKARYVDEEGQVFTEALAYLALALLTSGEHVGPGILGIDYDPDDGWKVCNAHDNFIALVPPGEEDEDEEGEP